MSPTGPSTLRLSAAAAAGSVLLAVGMPWAAAAPATDDQGFVGSTARCATPTVAVAFGSTATARVAICKSPRGEFEYRGVRVKDGAGLILSATRSDDGAFVAENEGVEYTVTTKSLVVSEGTRVIREESWVDFHGPEGPQAPSTSATTSTSTSLPPPMPAELGGS